MTPSDLSDLVAKYRAFNDTLEKTLRQPVRVSPVLFACADCGRKRELGHKHCQVCERKAGGR